MAKIALLVVPITHKETMFNIVKEFGYRTWSPWFSCGTNLEGNFSCCGNKKMVDKIKDALPETIPILKYTYPGDGL